MAFVQLARRAAQAAREYNSLDFFPIRKTAATYQKAYLGGDIRAGINVALLAFPQGMAYALIAGLPIQYGIYGSAIAALIAPLFARSRFITLGPTNATSVMLLSAFASLQIVGPEKIAMVPLLVLLVGLFICLGAYFKVANLVQYISRSVITGYITAAALLIITNQIPKTLGLELPAKGATFLESISIILPALDTWHGLTLVLSLITAGLFILLNWKLKSLPNVAICLVALSVISALAFGPEADSGVKHLTGIDARSWSVSIPSFKLEDIQLMASPAIAIALLCVLEGISIGKSLAAKTGSRLDANQAMLSIGMANVGCAFLSGVPASGSLTRSSLSESSGGKTPVASIISGVIVFIGAFVLGPFTGYIPQCTLAVLVIAIGLSLLNKHAIRVVTRATRSDAIVFGMTFFSGMILPLDTAIYIGVGISIMLFLKKAARPEMVEYAFNESGELAEMAEPEQRDVPEVSIVHVEGELFFGAAELFQDQMRRICEDRNLKIVVLKMRNAYNMDATGVMALEELVRYMNDKGRYLILSEVKVDMVRVLKNAGLYDYIEDRNIFRDDPQNPTMSTAKALKRAKEHLGDTEATVSIYIDPVRDQQKSGERH
ncbi:SulP family inorganic anion transporter [Coraliomargarita akajimensis]|uniref:Sulphate transporter n=1 Tax=Coraliomargarita akajimensis (strain DSM 45221 / IAM 15411 / JCM 23193 / KCTC 12865 / 04OKA010-24) TaxID=583355 RepID=D5ELU9_CORAD|nr:SulP family inorganic anion transporter [Coraliomargarita akajimensis]ADE53274.1 sulphate transporter [Coraliomargarita akajimensis DSM 45221]